MIERILALVLLLGLALPAQETLVRDDLETVMAAALAEGARPWDQDALLWQVGTRDHGKIEPVLMRLRKLLADEVEAAETSARVLLGLLLERDGRPEEALPILVAVPEGGRSYDLALEIAQLEDVLGKTEEARKGYVALLGRELEPEFRKTIQLRLALIDEKNDYEALLGYARSDDLDPGRRNEAAVVLGLGNRQAEAIELFTVTGEKGERYRQLVRLAEWALGAQNFKAAQTFAWDAVGAAITKRDRRYGLSLVSSAYRAAEQMDELLARFEAEAELSLEARRVWIELLREEGRAQEALRLFNEEGETEWSAAQKRQLLEICRETGDDKVLVDGYRRLIAEEPENLEWRSGLSRHYLENGQADEAREVWTSIDLTTRSADDLLDAARQLAEVGLVDTAVRFARAAAEREGQRDSALLFIARLEHQRGRYERLIEVLGEIDAGAEPQAGIRAEVAGDYERIGRIDLSVATLESLREAHGGFLGTDLEMKYALSLSKLGREEEAMVVWRDLWGRLRGTPRGRYVEDRLMTVASRIGSLAKIAIELEDRLAQGSADTKDIDLLVRLYIKVNDPASATEIIEEYLKNIGTADLEILKRKAQIYAACNDFYHYEQVCHQLIELDEENRLDHMRELVMSQLDRGRRDQAIAMLPKIRAAGGDEEDIADEFEAGVYGLAGMKEEALESYMRGLGRAPDRIDTLLLVANLLQETGREMQAARRFQQLAMRAEKDDLFTIAIDGILNLRAPRNSRVPNSIVSWARRVTLERLAGNPDRFYLYRLVADLSEELNDIPFSVRTLKAAIPISGERRTPLLREIMGKVRSLDPAARQTFGMDSGLKVSPNWDATDYLMVGRRLLGQGEYVPPQVFMDMAAVFIAKDRIDDAMRTFSRASELLDRGEVTLQAAQVLEKARCYGESLTFYRRLLATDAENVVLIEKVGELEELCADETEARRIYERGLDVALGQMARRVTREVDEKKPDDPWGGRFERNVNALDATVPKLVSGLVATLPDREAALALVERLAADIRDELAVLGPESGGPGLGLAEHPRLDRLATSFRQIGLVYRMQDLVDPIDARLIALFPDDGATLRRIVTARTSRGLSASAAALLRGAGKEDVTELAAQAGIASLDGRRLSPAAVAQEILPRMNEPESLARLLERVDTALASEAEAKLLPHLMAASIVLGRNESAETFARAAIRLIAGRGFEGLQRGMVMLGVAGRVSPELSQELLETLVERVLDKEPQLAASLSWRVEELPGVTISKDLARKVALKMVEVAVKGRPVYGLANWLNKIPAEERPAFVRELHDLLEADQKLPFLMDAMSHLEDPLDQAYIDWYAKAVETSASRSNDGNPPRINLNMGDDGASLSLKLAVLDLLEKRGDVEGVRIQRWLALFSAGRGAEVMAEIKADLPALAKARQATGIAQYHARRLLDKIGESDQAADFLALIEQILENTPDDVELQNIRLELASNLGGPAYRKLIDEALAKKPDDLAMLQRLRQHHFREGDSIAALEVLKRMAELQPDNDNWKRQLISAYKGRRMPLEAEGIRLELEAKTILEEQGGKTTGGGLSASATTTLIASSGMVAIRTVSSGRIVGDDRNPVASIKKLLAAGKSDEARAALRRLWRGLGNTERYQPPVSYRLAWRDPAAAQRQPGEKGPRTILGALADKADFIPDEARRILLFLEGEEEAPQDWLVNELIDLAMPAEEGARRTLLDELSAKVTAGQAGGMEVARIFVLLEDAWVSDQQRSTIIDSLVARRAIPDARQVRGLARGLAAGDRKDQAARLYLLAALMSNASDDGGYLNDTSSWNDLLEEAEKVLGGELGVTTTLAMLENLRPSDYRLGSWLSLAVEVWERILPADNALARMLELLQSDDQGDDSWEMQQIRPNIARVALAAGQVQTAMDVLAPMICKRDSAPRNRRGVVMRVTRNEGLARNALVRMWQRYDREQRKQIQLDVDLAGLFEALRSLHEQEKLEFPAAVFAALASRLCELETMDEVLGRRLVDTLAGFESDEVSFLRARAQLERKVGNAETAFAIERGLRERQRLGIDRLAEQVRELAAHDGAERAFDIGVELARWCNHPDLLDEMIKLADGLGEEKAATKYRELKEAVLAQEAATKERLEAEKRKALGEEEEEVEEEP